VREIDIKIKKRSPGTRGSHQRQTTTDVDARLGCVKTRPRDHRMEVGDGPDRRGPAVGQIEWEEGGGPAEAKMDREKELG
jgi:hypothetical protein